VQVVELDPPVRRGPISRLHLGKAMAPMLGKIDPDIIFLPGNFHFPLVLAFGKAKGARRSSPRFPTLPSPAA
jgi:hypothetical protein